MGGLPAMTKCTATPTDPRPVRRVVIVTRMSDDEPDNAVNHGTQEAGCRRHAAAIGAAVAAVFRDNICGDRLDRPGLRLALDMLRAGEADILLVYALDRFSRNQVQQAIIVSEVRRAGGEVISATEDVGAGPLG